MEINPNDNTPVQQSYNAIPRVLYGELKSYIEDLLNKKWNIYSKSSHSSPVVAVRKNMAPCGCVVIIANLTRKQFQTEIRYREFKTLLTTWVVTTSSAC